MALSTQAISAVIQSLVDSYRNPHLTCWIMANSSVNVFFFRTINNHYQVKLGVDYKMAAYL